MEKVGYILLAIVAAAWLIVILVGMVAAWPYGIVGFVILAGLGLLFAQVVKERLENKEDDYYSKNVDQ
ncbi:MAG: hypothetical protein GXO83_02315 [Chlorobi bacterium]|nr:hypothetical protein [Chlorobiota bacterium]